MKFAIILPSDHGGTRAATVEHDDIDEVYEWAERRWPGKNVDVEPAPSWSPPTAMVA